MLHVFREIRLFSTCRIQAIPSFETDLKYDSFTGFNQEISKIKRGPKSWSFGTPSLTIQLNESLFMATIIRILLQNNLIHYSLARPAVRMIKEIIHERLDLFHFEILLLNRSDHLIC